jgi:Flp pilus assembly protein TadD
MATRAGRVFIATTACLHALAGCETQTKLGDLFQSKSEATESISPPGAEAISTGNSAPRNLEDPNDNLSLGKKYFRAADFGLAERHFRRAVELHPRDLESRIGVAASYDRLRRFDLADRAYDQAIKIAGPTPEILNNIGYSLMLRGDYRRARETLLQAQAQDPGNPYVRNNLELLEASFRNGKAIQ